MVKIAPSILSGDFANLGKSVEDAENWGADYIHFDVMDGCFVPNITFGAGMLRAVKKYTKLPLDVHLMIDKPERFVEEFCDSGADIITFHQDASECARETLIKIKDKGKKCGLVVNPDKKIMIVEPYLDILDVILIMGVYPGFGGQQFIRETLDKITEAKLLIGETSRQIDLEIDGGVTVDNVSEMTSRGINIVVAGNAIYKSDNPKNTIRRLRV